MHFPHNFQIMSLSISHDSYFYCLFCFWDYISKTTQRRLASHSSGPCLILPNTGMTGMSHNLLMVFSLLFINIPLQNQMTVFNAGVWICLFMFTSSNSGLLILEAFAFVTAIFLFGAPVFPAIYLLQ